MVEEHDSAAGLAPAVQTPIQAASPVASEPVVEPAALAPVQPAVQPTVYAPGAPLEVQVAVAKINKYATSESGDTVELVERPKGGFSVVVADGQRSGRSAKAISNIVARKAVQLLSEGVRDGAAARAAHDYLYTNRGGKVSATLNIISVDIRTRTLVISRNNESPVLVHTAADGFYLLDEPSVAVGVHRSTKPVIAEVPIEVNTLVVAFTDTRPMPMPAISAIPLTGGSHSTPRRAVSSVRSDA